MKAITSYNPSKNFKELGQVPTTSNDEIKKKVLLSKKTNASWGRMPIKERIVWVEKIYKVCKDRSNEIALMITKEVGTAITECTEEIAWDWDYFEWFIKHAEEILSPETTYEDDTTISQVLYEPLGTAAVITPWNLPFDLFLWGVIPNLLAGNTVIYKVAEECALTGKLLEEIIKSTNLPDGVLSFIHGIGEQGEYLVNQDIDLIWFTGSTEIGKKLYEVAGKKKIRAVLEMGGSNPAVIFPDANIDAALSTISSKRFMFSGQTCDAIKRLIVHESIFDEVVDTLKNKVEQIKVGDPEDPNTQMGPLISKKQLDTLTSQVDDSIKNGAAVAAKTTLDKNLKGAFYPPTILTNVNRSMRVWKEEIFGPVLPIVKFKTIDEAVELANDTEYGLTAQIYTQDKKIIEQFTPEVKAGSIDINGASHFKPSNPFGGCKNSGMGREHGTYGLRELCELKLVSRKK